MKKLFTILFTALALCACEKTGNYQQDEKAPAPVFSYEAYGTTVKFINHTQHANYYEWSFGDGKSSNDNEPRHTYSKAGTYTVTLKAFNTRSTIYTRGYSTSKTIKVTE